MNEDQDRTELTAEDVTRILCNDINETSGNNTEETSINIDDRTPENITINELHRLHDSITGSMATELQNMTDISTQTYSPHVNLIPAQDIHTTFTTMSPNFTMNRSGYVQGVMSADYNNDIIVTNTISNNDGTYTEEQINISKMFREYEELKREIAEIKEILKNHKEMFKTVNSELNIFSKITAMR